MYNLLLLRIVYVYSKTTLPIIWKFQIVLGDIRIKLKEYSLNLIRLIPSAIHIQDVPWEYSLLTSIEKLKLGGDYNMFIAHFTSRLLTIIHED